MGLIIISLQDIFLQWKFATICNMRSRENQKLTDAQFSRHPFSTYNSCMYAHCGKNSILLICSKNPVGTNIAIRGHPSYWWINKEINPLLLLAHISCNFLKWSHDQEVAWLYIFDPKKFKNLKIYSVTSIFLRNKLSWILKWVVPEGGSNFENLM